MLVSPPQSSNNTAQMNVTTSTVPLKAHNDYSQPLADFVVCCTSIADEKRTSLAAQAEQMGAVHRYDLTLDVTHLIIGKHDTEKYHYVARERPDVRPMTVAWVEAIRDLWVNDKEINMDELEKEHTLPTLQSLKISMTGCDDPTERADIAARVQSNGAVYEGDLTKQITHLIAFRTEGAKYKAAKTWGIKCVSIEWLSDSLERGMILNETLYDPILPTEERGRGAWDKTKPRTISPGKRKRVESAAGSEGAKKKLRRTASMKLNSQSDLLWDDIVGGVNEAQVNRSGQWDISGEVSAVEESVAPRVEVNIEPRHLPAEVPRQNGMFSGHYFHYYGFSASQAEIVQNHLTAHGARIANTMGELVSLTRDVSTRLFIMVPHDLPISQHHEHPTSNTTLETVTVWWLERCLHHKMFLEPAEHVIGRPFTQFPIERFETLTISTSAFTKIDLLLVTKSIKLLGATYSEDVTPQTSVIVVKELHIVRADKFAFAQQYNIPIVSADWLWGSIEAGTRLSFQKFRARERKTRKPLEEIQVEKAAELLRGDPQAQESSNNDTSPSKATSTISKEADVSSLKISQGESETGGAGQKEEPDSLGPEPSAIATSTIQDFPEKTQPLTERDFNSSSKTISTAPAPSDHPRTRETYNSEAISDLLAKTKTAIPQKEISRGRSGPKRILGRVASNLSTGSAGHHSRAASMDSTAHGVITEQTNEDKEDAASRTANERIELMMKRATNDVESQPPPATQLGYDDPESRVAELEAKAKMMGEKVPKRTGLKEKTFTISDAESMAPRARRTRNGGR